MKPLYLAWRYIAHHRWKTAILCVCVTLTLYLPFAAHRILQEFQRDWMARAESTPLVVGAKGSSFDLTLHALYFKTAALDSVPMAEVERIGDSGYALAVPLFLKHTAQDYPVVGTSLDYLDWRGLEVAEGSGLTLLGDCLLGSAVAEDLGLKPGDRILTDPENVFDIAGAYPLNMLVRGVLAETGTPDDNAIFTDIKTAWIVEGLGHGHQDLAEVADEGVIMERAEGRITANAALEQFTVITEENLNSFHFHAEENELPATAVIALPYDAKSAVLLRGRYESPSAEAQILVPSAVVADIMDMIFRIKRLFDASTLLIALTTALFLLLVVLLSLRLRARERRIMADLGCARGTIAAVLAAELTIVFAISVLLAAALTALTLPIAGGVIRQIFF